MSSQPENTEPSAENRQDARPPLPAQPPLPPQGAPDQPAQPVPPYGDYQQQPGHYQQQSPYFQQSPYAQAPQAYPAQGAPAGYPPQYGQAQYGQAQHGQTPYGQAQYGQPSFGLPQNHPGHPAPSYPQGPLDPGIDFGFAPAIRSGFRTMFQFSGRAGRREFWWWYLFVALAAAVVGTLAAIFFSTGLSQAVAGGDYTEIPGTTQVQVTSNASMILGFVLWGVSALFSVLALIGVGTRRLRDGGFSPWLLLLALIPGGGLVVLILWVLPSKPQNSSFGAAG
ncbi:MULTISPECIES: DUF805 domain-containing protein [Arthrobacter]|uniref:DUF805 domain-containing protein n=2 Tax=Arthrobacter TaxID=1663 RepID=A0ABU9KJW0_9MICC|nr:DUF805 domain-containing protein [Arthrobacter sp. YJM1]MDP5227151.1 DUF805 domain-containing protein [Arthrobacter sp. YJM1]